MPRKTCVDRLLDWYSQNARQLPWRRSRDPYAVWVSEMMLQQTRVETVIPYYERWMERFPTVQDLAQASLDDVLSHWEGLGYYSRARSLHRAARQVVEQHGGVIPSTLEDLRKLPGIGPYTAGAIASIAFEADTPALDGNIRRVLSRLFDVSIPARSPEGERILWDLAAEHLPAGRAGEYNQALMDLGAQICIPRNPRCLVCPVNIDCLAFKRGVQNQRPVLQKLQQTPHYIVTAAVIWTEGKVLIARRPVTGLLGGMWEFPGGKQQEGEDLPTCLQREIREELGAEIEVGPELGVYRHAYTHFSVTLHAFECKLIGAGLQAFVHAEIAWAAPEELHQFPMGKIDRMISRDLLSRQNGSE
jgi:A/G-specific adenine glycosylase